MDTYSFRKETSKASHMLIFWAWETYKKTQLIIRRMSFAGPEDKYSTHTGYNYDVYDPIRGPTHPTRFDSEEKSTAAPSGWWPKREINCAINTLSASKKLCVLGRAFLAYTSRSHEPTTRDDLIATSSQAHKTMCTK